VPKTVWRVAFGASTIWFFVHIVVAMTFSADEAGITEASCIYELGGLRNRGGFEASLQDIRRSCQEDPVAVVLQAKDSLRRYYLNLGALVPLILVLVIGGIEAAMNLLGLKI
jgi:hypothetical protein